MAELETIAPHEYTDAKLRKLVISNVQHDEEIRHLVQNCVNDMTLTYEQCAAYLRKNAILISHFNKSIPPTRLMHTDTDNEIQDPGNPTSCRYDTAEKVTRLFHTMALSGGVSPTYNIFATKSFRENLSIPYKIWAELDPIFKDKINEI